MRRFLKWVVAIVFPLLVVKFIVTVSHSIVDPSVNVPLWISWLYTMWSFLMLAYCTYMSQKVWKELWPTSELRAILHAFAVARRTQDLASFYEGSSLAKDKSLHIKRTGRVFGDYSRSSRRPMEMPVEELVTALLVMAMRWQEAEVGSTQEELYQSLTGLTLLRIDEEIATLRAKEQPPLLALTIYEKEAV
jgi:hypothetical protein